MIPLRALPRIVLPGATRARFDLPDPALAKLRKVLRLNSGDEFAAVPGDGTIVRCRLEGHEAFRIEVARPETEPSVRVHLAQALPKGDKLDEIVRAATEIGAASFVIFPSERTVVRWEPRKVEERLSRLRAIIAEGVETSFRTRIPRIEWRVGLAEALTDGALVLSESEAATGLLPAAPSGEVTLVVGPEGGWSPAERALFAGREVTLGPRVLRTEHAGPAALAALLTPRG